MAEDIVCRRRADEESRYFSDYDGNMYRFCSPECKRRFDGHPDQFIQERAKEELRLTE